METAAGIKLTEEEIKLIESLERIAKKWNKTTKRLWLFSGSGTLNVMMRGDSDTNPESKHLNGGVNPNNVITTIDIANDGGDW